MTNKATKLELLELLEEKEQRKKYNKLKHHFPDSGKFSRDLYQKHINFMQAGINFRQRLFMAGNRTGKTQTGAYEMACHLTGLYPDWWKGRRFDKPIKAWAASYTGPKTADTCQTELYGPYTDPGTGFIPKDLIGDTKTKPGVPNALSYVEVKHVSGGFSSISFKSYDQGVEAYVGTAMDVIWLDEEPKYDIFSECLIRTMTTQGIVYVTFTPDQGLSDTVLSFFENGSIYEGGRGHKYVTTVSWDECPHLEQAEKDMLMETIPLWQRSAKSKGIPSVGAGAIYPVAEEDFVVKPFEIPTYFQVLYGLDVGWNKTAAIWIAKDPSTNTCYVYSEYYRGQAEPPVHSAAIRTRGDWVRGFIDPAANGRSQADGKQLRIQYRDLGLNLRNADNTVEAGIHKCYLGLTTDKLKVFSTCTNLLQEMRLYRRDKDGKIIKENDHACDAMRYAMMSIDYATSEAEELYTRGYDESDYRHTANPITGY